MLVHSIALHNGEQAMPRGRQPDGPAPVGRDGARRRYPGAIQSSNEHREELVHPGALA